MTFVSGMGRRLDMEAVLPGSGFYSPGEGLAVRRGEQGHWLISSDDGQFFLFEADPHHPQRQRLKMLGDRNSNCLNLYYDELGRIADGVVLRRTHAAYQNDGCAEPQHALRV